MRWSDLSLNPPARTLRQFAGLWVVFFLGLALWQGLVLERSILGVVLAALALTVGPLGLTRPAWIRPVFAGWMILAFPIGWVVSQVLLGSIYYGVITPVGLLFKLFGRDALIRRRGAGESYWLPKQLPDDQSRYLKQF